MRHSSFCSLPAIDDARTAIAGLQVARESGRPVFQRLSESMNPRSLGLGVRSLFGPVSQKRWWKILVWVMALTLLLLLAGLTAPLVLRCRKLAELTEAVSNARQIGLALAEFDKVPWTPPAMSGSTARTFSTPRSCSGTARCPM